MKKQTRTTRASVERIHPPPPKNILNRSSGLSSPSNWAPFRKEVEKPEAREPIPPSLSSGSAPLSYAARFWGLSKIYTKFKLNSRYIIPDSTWNALDTTRKQLSNGGSQRNNYSHLKASSAPGAPFLSGCKAKASSSIC
jgi:hypothetical protein